MLDYLQRQNRWLFTLIGVQESNKARAEASGLKNYFMTLNAIVLLTVWLKVLQCIDSRNVVIQSGKISLDTEVVNIIALRKETLALRDGWELLLSEAELTGTQMLYLSLTKNAVGNKKEKIRRWPSSRGDSSGHCCNSDLLPLSIIIQENVENFLFWIFAIKKVKFDLWQVFCLLLNLLQIVTHVMYCMTWHTVHVMSAVCRLLHILITRTIL